MLPSKTAEIIERLLVCMPNDLCRTIVQGSIRAIGDDNNPIRANLFALGVRETIRIMLDCMAPDKKVRQTPWFQAGVGEKQASKNAEGQKKAEDVTRRDRMRYATQGGLSDKLLSDLDLDPEVMHADLVVKVNQLSKFAHISPASMLSEENEVLAFVEEVAQAVIDFVDQIHAVRGEIATAVSDSIQSEADLALTETEVDGLDELSTHTRVDEVAVEHIKVLSIDESYVHIEASGTVYVELIYGSGSDERNGMGARMTDNYPFTMAMKSPVTNLNAVERVWGPKVDNRSFYEGDEEE